MKAVSPDPKFELKVIDTQNMTAEEALEVVVLRAQIAIAIATEPDRAKRRKLQRFLSQPQRWIVKHVPFRRRPRSFGELERLDEFLRVRMKAQTKAKPKKSKET